MPRTQDRPVPIPSARHEVAAAPPARPPAIRLVGIEKRFDGAQGHQAVRGLDLAIGEGELLVLLGPSGCGKTTTLNMLAGLEKPTAGQLYFGDRLMNEVPPDERDIAMVFQSIALYPHLNVRDNVGFALRTQKTPRTEIARRVAEVAGILGIDGLLDRKIHQVSGGQRQRVAIAKALVRRPHLFLLDEPFSSLDAELRRQMRSELIRIHHDVATTMVFVTHDQEEAMAIADRIAVMRDGELVQLGPPLDLYRAPVNRWLARFIGSHPINLLPAQLRGDRVRLLPDGGWNMAIPPAEATRLRGVVGTAEPVIVVGVRPESVRVLTGAADGEGAGDGAVAARVYTRQILGTEILYELKAGEATLRAVTPSTRLLEVGEAVALAFDWSEAFAFDAGTEQRI